jgi:hypothetical protein
MVHRDTDWRPKGAMESYKGHEVWEYEVGPHEKNDGEVDGDVDIDDAEADE